jgi:hypothetical protein
MNNNQSSFSPETGNLFVPHYIHPKDVEPGKLYVNSRFGENAYESCNLTKDIFLHVDQNEPWLVIKSIRDHGQVPDHGRTWFKIYVQKTTCWIRFYDVEQLAICEFTSTYVESLTEPGQY